MYIDLPFLLIYVSLSGLLLVHDLRTGLLPDKFTCPLLWGGLIYHQCCRPAQLSDALWGAVAGYGVFALFYWGYRLICRQEGLGFGDVRFLAALGAWHRWESLPLRETGTKKPAAIWAISGGCGFCYWPGKYDTGWLVTDFNLRLQIIL